MVPSHATAVQPRLKSWTGRISLGVDASHLSFLPSVPSPSPVIAPPMSHPFPSLLFFPSPLKFGEEVWGSTVSFPQWPAKKRQPVAKVGRNQMHLVSMILKVGRDASYGSRKVDAPMLTLLRHMSQFPLTRHLLRVIRRVTCSKGLFTAHELNRNKPHFANSRENSHTGELVER